MAHVSARMLSVQDLETWQHYYPAMQMFVFTSKSSLLGLLTAILKRILPMNLFKIYLSN